MRRLLGSLTCALLATLIQTPVDGRDARAAPARRDTAIAPEQAPGGPPGVSTTTTIPKAVPVATGIDVGDVKFYDSQALQALLNVAVTRLAQLNAFDPTNLTNRLGTNQGANIIQNQLGLQASGLPSPQVVATANGTTPSQVTTNNAVTPVSPGAPAPPTFSPPQAFSPSSLDVLNEETQLNEQISELELLLSGALNDEVGRLRVTIGLPISISVPQGFEYRDAVAEVLVTTCRSDAAADTNDAPTLVTLLPSERTYNVANVVSSSDAVGTGVVTGIVNVGGGFLRGHQTYYLAKDQDTLSLQRPATKCGSKGGVSFGWQFRPVLGQAVIRDGVRHTLVQISLPTAASQCSVPLHVQIGWRKYDRGTARVGSYVSRTELDSRSIRPPRTVETVSGLVTIDNGDKTLSVKVVGAFAPGLKVRVGNAILGPSSAGFNQSNVSIMFTAQADGLARSGALLVDSDGQERALVFPYTDPVPTCSEKPGTAPAPTAFSDLLAATTKSIRSLSLLMQPTATSAADKIGVRFISASTAEITLTFASKPKADSSSGYPEVVLIGDKVFGLRDAPFVNRDDNSLSVLVPVSVLQHSDGVVAWKQLFTANHVEFLLTPSQIELFTVDHVTLLRDGDPVKFQVAGSNLKGVKIVQPVATDLTLIDESTAVFELSKAEAVAKSIVFQKDDSPAVTIALPSGQASQDPKPTLKTHDPIAIGTSALKIEGTMMDSIVAVNYLGRSPQAMVWADDKTSVAVTFAKDSGFAAGAGIVVLTVVYADGTSKPFPIKVLASTAGASQ